MNKITKFNSFIIEGTNSKIGKKRLLPFKIDSIRDTIHLYEVCPKIYAIAIEDIRIRAFLFMRYQEFYESPSSKFKLNRFNIDSYINWYMEETKNKDLFTYSYDWLGFNIPSTSLENCLEIIYDKNEYDEIMSKIVSTIRQIQSEGSFYLLGTDSIESDIMDHEMSHGLYFTNLNYKNKMDEITNSLPKEIFNSLYDLISSMGYDSSVINDEIQAYMSTGLESKMSKISGIEKYSSLYRKVFGSFMVKNPATKIEWN